MSWQERDYAQDPQAAYASTLGRPPGRGIWGGNIVKRLMVANIVIYILSWIIITPLSYKIRGYETGRKVPTAHGWAVIPEKHVPGYGEMVTTKVLQGQVWRLITSQYLHAQKMDHLIFNMLGLYFLGQALQPVWGNKKFFIIYTIAGVCGNLALMAAGIIGWISPSVPAVGASGCILGLLGAAAILFPHAQVWVYFLFPIRIRTAAIGFCCWYALNIVFRGSNYGGDLCHIAGLAFGAWWAWRGERWWGTRPSVLPRQPPRPAPPRVWPGAGRGAWGRKVQARQADENTVNQILAKVHEGGIATLSDQEKRTLLEATERLRAADIAAGRVDRL